MSEGVHQVPSLEQLPQNTVSGWPVAWMLCQREWTRFFRQRNRVIGGLGQPILLWILMGTGMHRAFQGTEGESFMSYYIPGTVGLILLFTAIFATISIIEDRKEGFLQSVLAAPVPRWSIVAGKVLGGSLVAWVQALLFLFLTAAIGSYEVSWKLAPLMVLMFFSAAGMTSLGFCFAWPMDSTQGFHAIMNLVLLPLWLLSGAFFPIPAVGSGDPFGQVVIHWMMRLNPVSYMIGGMRSLMLPVEGTNGIPSHAFWHPNSLESWSVTVAFAGALFAIAVWQVHSKKLGETS